MSEKQMEKNLNHGDSNNLFYFFSDICKTISETVEKNIDSIVKKD
jgi:hypothetical protein